jgi:hypothetical protein
MSGAQVFANDRAPARHADKANGRPQRTAGVSFADYLAYYRGCGASPGAEGGAAPFYLNGWRASFDHPVRCCAEKACVALLTSRLHRT